MRRTTPLIVGGGPAGAAAALVLARTGQRPLVLERQRATPDAICGGFLSWATLDRLERLGVRPDTLGSHPVGRLRLLAPRHAAEVALPSPGAGLSRRTLDRALLDAAMRAGAAMERGVLVRGIRPDAVELADGASLAAAHIVLATGKHDMRGTPRVAPPGGRTLGLRWRLKTTPRLDRLLAGCIELHLFAGGYAGLLRQEDGSANLCLAVGEDRWTAEGRRPELLLAALSRELPALEARLSNAASIGPADAIGNVPYGWRAAGRASGLYRVGDQIGVIPSLAGEGIAIALASGEAAATAIAAGRSPDAYQHRFVRTLAVPMGIAEHVRRVAARPGRAAALVTAARRVPALPRLIARLTRV